MAGAVAAVRGGRGAAAQVLILAAALTLPTLVMATQLYVGYRLAGIPMRFGAVLLVQLCHWELWALAGPLVWRLARRWPLVHPRRRNALLRHMVAAPLVAAAVLLLFLSAYHALLRLPPLSAWLAGLDRSLTSTAVFFFAAYFHVELLIYGGVVAVAQASRTASLLRAREHEALRLEAALTGARLTALRTQLQPHFLFNALHTIGSLVLQGKGARAVQLLAELGELLRATLAHRDTDLAPLREEIAYLQRYLTVEDARFGDRLTIRWDIEPAALNALVPPFILQPLVENAFRHGISRRSEHSTLTIGAVTEAGSLRMTICNDGPPLPERFSPGEGGGFGLKNVIERLRTRNPPGRLALVTERHRDTSEPTGVRATVVLPLWSGNDQGTSEDAAGRDR